MLDYTDKRRISLNNVSKHPLVIKSLENVLNTFGLEKGTVNAFAEGGMGVLFLLNNFQGKKALLKIPAYSNRPTEKHWLLRNNIKKEGIILEQLENIAIPKLFFKEPTGEYIIREFIDGETLSVYKTKAASTSIRQQISLALINTVKLLFHAVHEHPKGNFVIRDFKPANLIFSDFNSKYLHLIDMGSIRSESEMISKTTRKHRLGTGKWLYWSPEQLLEDKAILDRRTDYFSFGATAYFIITGRPPYSNSISEKSKVMLNYLKEYEAIQKKLTDSSKLQGFPKGLIEMIIHCLNPIAKNRKFNLY